MCEFFNRPRKIRLIKIVIEVCDHALNHLSYEVAHAMVSLQLCLKWVLRHALVSEDWDQRSLQRAFRGALITHPSRNQPAGELLRVRHQPVHGPWFRLLIRVESVMDAMQEIHRLYRNLSPACSSASESEHPGKVARRVPLWLVTLV